MKRALITGITGQDGSYLAEFLLEKEYEVYGLVRRTADSSRWRIAHILDRLTLINGDLSDYGSIESALKQSQPGEIYHLGAQSFVALSFQAPEYTADITAEGSGRLFEAVRRVCPTARVYQASSSEQFGQNPQIPSTEESLFFPTSPYACAKVAAHVLAQMYRRTYNLHICCGIAFNHESPRRGEEFVTRKITQAVAKIKVGKQKELKLGNLSARRDWSHAKDIVRGMWLSLQPHQPDDYLFASGKSHSVEDLAVMAFNLAGLDWKSYVKVDQAFLRPSDNMHLVGNAEKARTRLGWIPMISFGELVEEMVNADLAQVGYHRPMPPDQSGGLGAPATLPPITQESGLSP